MLDKDPLSSEIRSRMEVLRNKTILDELLSENSKESMLAFTFSTVLASAGSARSRKRASAAQLCSRRAQKAQSLVLGRASVSFDRLALGWRDAAYWENKDGWWWWGGQSPEGV